MKKLFYFFLILFSSGFAGASVQIVENTPGKIQLLLKTPQPNVSVVDSAGERFSKISVQDWPNTIGDQALPF